MGSALSMLGSQSSGPSSFRALSVAVFPLLLYPPILLLSWVVQGGSRPFLSCPKESAPFTPVLLEATVCSGPARGIWLFFHFLRCGFPTTTQTKSDNLLKPKPVCLGSSPKTAIAGTFSPGAHSDSKEKIPSRSKLRANKGNENSREQMVMERKA